MSARRAGLVAVAASAVCFGSLGIFGKRAQGQGVTLATLLALRFAIAAVVLWAVALTQRGLVWPGLRRSAGIAAMGLLYVGQALCYFTSLRTVPAAVTAIMLYLYPVLVTLLAWRLFGERLSAVGAATLGLAVLGVLLVVGVSTSDRLDVAGVLWGRGSALVYSTYILLGTRLLQGVNALVATAIVATTAAVALLIGGALLGELRGFDGAGWITVLGMALVATVIPATLFLYGLARVGPSQASVVSTLEPASTALLAALVLGEALSLRQALGGALVVVAAALAAWRGRAAVEPPGV